MIGLSQTHSKKLSQLEKKLDGLTDVSRVSNVVCEWIDDVSANYISQVDLAYSRQTVNCMIDVAKTAARMMGAVDRASWRFAPSPERRTRFTAKDFVKFVGPGLMLVTAAVCLILGQTAAACISAIAAAADLAVNGVVVNRPAVEASPAVNKDEVIARLTRLFEEIDAQLAESVVEFVGEEPRLTRGMVEGVQMLMEARLTNDGEYALKSVPQMADALKKQGVTLELFSPERKKDFDLLPSVNGGDTIRPAIRQGEKLLLRGQATSRI